MRRDLVGVAAIATASVSFGGVVVVGKTLTDGELAVSVMLAIRFAVAGLVLGVGVLAFRRSLRPAKAEGARLLILGALGYGLEAASFFLAVERGTASAVTLLFFVYPVIVTALSVAIDRVVPKPMVLASLAAAVAGTALIVTSSGGIDISVTGVLFALGAAGIYAVYLTGTERFVTATSPAVAAVWVSFGASALLVLVSVGGGGVQLPVGAREWSAVAGMGVLTAFAFVTLLAGLRLLGAVRTAIIAAFEPLATAVLAGLVLHERLRAMTVMGAALILGGATAAGLARSHRPEIDSQIP